jgi:hypothetical protein
LHVVKLLKIGIGIFTRATLPKASKTNKGPAELVGQYAISGFPQV